MIDTFYFDKNIFYKSQAELYKFKYLTCKNNIACHYPPRTYWELVSKINKADFHHRQILLRRLREICSNNVLPHSQEVLAAFFHIEPNIDDLPTTSDYIKHRDIIINAQSCDDVLRQGIADFKTITDWRKNYETCWVEHFRNMVEDVRNTVAECKCASKTSKRVFRQFLVSLEYKRIFLIAMLGIALRDRIEYVALTNRIKSMELSEVDETLKPLEAYFNAYRWVSFHKAVGNYSDEKLKNDFNDFELLFYLGFETFAFITNDKKIRKKIKEMDKDCEQIERILTFNEAVWRCAIKNGSPAI